MSSSGLWIRMVSCLGVGTGIVGVSMRGLFDVVTWDLRLRVSILMAQGPIGSLRVSTGLLLRGHCRDIRN